MAEEVLPNLNPSTAALYGAEKAKLEFSEKRGQERAKETRGLTNANYEYNRGLNTRAEPLKLHANVNAANTAGLAESGQLARTQGLTQTDFAQKQGRLGEVRRNAIQKINTGLAEEGVKYGEAQQANVARANAEQEKYLVEHPPEPTLGSPGNPVKAVAQPNYGQPVPQVVSSKPQPSSNGPRKGAVQKIKARWGVG